MSGIALSHNGQINPAKARCFDQFKGLDFLPGTRFWQVKSVCLLAPRQNKRFTLTTSVRELS